MARKSRITEKQPPLTLRERIYKVGLYIRLSVLDSGKKDSDTLESQEDILRKFIEGKSEFSLVSVYVDNGQTGVNFERDEFERLLSDVRSGKVDCIIVKDLSRFGRNYIEAGEYLETVFPFMKVRFIAVNDRYDNIDPASSDILTMHLKNLVNDVYARDISQKICPVLRGKQERGEFIGAWAAYGYLKSEEDKHRLVVDEETAPIVRDIFLWRSMGHSYQSIAKMLREKKIPSPSQYRYAKGLIKNKRLGQAAWQIAAIKQLLANEVYLGHMVQGRKREALWQGQHQKYLPSEQWIVVRNTHEPIIEEELFLAVQEINRQASEAYWEKKKRFDHIQNTENILKGLVYCGDCGAKLTRYKNVRENKKKDPRFHVWYSYICPVHATASDRCSFTSIPEQELYDAVYAVLQTHFKMAQKIQSHMEQARYHRTVTAEQKNIQTQIDNANAELVRISRHRETLYDDYADRLMSESDYLYARKRYEEKEKQLREKIDRLIEEQRVLTLEKTTENPGIKSLLHFQTEPCLTRAMALELIESVIVHSKTEITVHLRFEDEYEKLRNTLTPVREVASGE